MGKLGRKPAGGAQLAFARGKFTGLRLRQPLSLQVETLA